MQTTDMDVERKFATDLGNVPTSAIAGKSPRRLSVGKRSVTFSKEVADGHERERAFWGVELSPISLLDDISNAVTDYVCDGFDNLERELTVGGTHPRTKEISERVDQMFVRVKKQVDKNMDKFELYTMKNIFAIPVGLQVDQPAPREIPQGADQDQKLDAEIHELRRNLLAGQYMNRSMKKELAQLDSELNACKSVGFVSSRNPLATSFDSQVTAELRRVLAKDKENKAEQSQLQQAVQQTPALQNARRRMSLGNDSNGNGSSSNNGGSSAPFVVSPGLDARFRADMDMNPVAMSALEEFTQTQTSLS